MQKHGSDEPTPKPRPNHHPKPGSNALEPPYRRTTDLCLGYIGNVELRVTQAAFRPRNLILGDSPRAHGLWAALALQEARIRPVLLVGNSRRIPDIVAWAVACGSRCLPAKLGNASTTAILLAPPSCSPSLRREGAERRSKRPGSVYVAASSNGVFDPPNTPTRWRQVILTPTPPEPLEPYTVLADLRPSDSQTGLNTAHWPAGTDPITLPKRSLPPRLEARLMARKPRTLAAHLRPPDRCSGDTASPNT